MRRSSLRHPIAVLRSIIEIAQPDFSRLVGIAESTLAKIESLRLPLSKENAIKICNETGASMRWLMAGDPWAPPIADELQFLPINKKSVPFTRKLFEEFRARIEAGDFPEIDVVSQLPLLELPAMAASARTLAQQRMFSYKVNKAYENLAKEFPIQPSEMARQEQRIAAQKKLEYALTESRSAARRAMAQPGNEDISNLLKCLIEWGVALGHIRQKEWQPKRDAIQASCRSNKKHSGRRRQRNKIKQKPKSQRPA
jgi:transcriptional regulator with XRE-family HTH domain